MKIVITEGQLKSITEAYVDSSGNLRDMDGEIFDEFPEDILETLKLNYFHLYQFNFDWNKKSDEFMTKKGEYDGKGHREWLKKNTEIEFKKNLDKIISSVRKDMILLKRREFAEEKFDEFGELLKSVFGQEITGEGLSEFEAAAIMYLGFNDDIETQKKKIEQAREDAKNIIDKYGNIDYSKTRKSNLFKDMITMDSFEKFVEKNPQYKKSFDIWKKLLYETIELSSKETIAFRYPSYDELKKLYNFLITVKSKI